MTLHSARSAYLRSAAHQPVHWREWGEDAFAAAREGDRPVLLDIGAAWCHWCHVMDGESYEDASLAGFLNEHFVCIKVDRDERPDDGPIAGVGQGARDRGAEAGGGAGDDGGLRGVGHGRVSPLSRVLGALGARSPPRGRAR